MNIHHYTIGIGSNWDAQKNIAYATEELNKIFDKCVVSTPKETEPIDMPNDYKFINCVASVHSDMNRDELKACLKSIESQCGRVAEDKAKGIIKLDLDIIKVDDIVLKEKDLEREYIIEGLKEIMQRGNKK
jgi:2-amino-4-hydroxy-6-hydroxymethyldihydropteridine diphosphokinase